MHAAVIVTEVAGIRWLGLRGSRRGTQQRRNDGQRHRGTDHQTSAPNKIPVRHTYYYFY